MRQHIHRILDDDAPPPTYEEAHEEEEGFGDILIIQGKEEKTLSNISLKRFFCGQVSIQLNMCWVPSLTRQAIFVFGHFP